MNESLTSSNPGEVPFHENFRNYLFIVGAQKAGTSALYSYLQPSPDFMGGKIKEKSFFSRDNFYSRGIGYYLSLYPPVATDKWGLDATPEYLYYEKCAARIHAFAPRAKIVILLREPASRALSAYDMYREMIHWQWFRQRVREANKDAREFFTPIVEGKAPFNLGHFLDKELEAIVNGGEAVEPSLIRRGLYAPQIERFIRQFGQQNVLVLFSSDLKKAPHGTVNRVLAFAGLGELANREYPAVNAREYRIDPQDRELIIRRAGELFARDKQQLIETFGLEVPW